MRSSITFTLGANFEWLTLSGAGKIDGTGNALSNHVTGNSGNNILSGYYPVSLETICSMEAQATIR